MERRREVLETALLSAVTSSCCRVRLLNLLQVQAGLLNIAAGTEAVRFTGAGCSGGAETAPLQCMYCSFLQSLPPAAGAGWSPQPRREIESMSLLRQGRSALQVQGALMVQRRHLFSACTAASCSHFLLLQQFPAAEVGVGYRLVCLTRCSGRDPRSVGSIETGTLLQLSLQPHVLTSADWSGLHD